MRAKFLDGSMSLGEVMQAASAFTIVQAAFNWLFDNYPKMADWTASARRVASLMIALDDLERAETEAEWDRVSISREGEEAALRLKNLSVRLNDGTAVVGETDVHAWRACSGCRRFRFGQEHLGTGNCWPLAVGERVG
jgi:vitamin B12/bleomycin/antimicrobial peptide transport system ATP-binding/permease protein